VVATAILMLHFARNVADAIHFADFLARLMPRKNLHF
jgi:hypothetical protein